MARYEYFSKEKAILKANELGVITYTEIICPHCKQSFFEVLDKNDSEQKRQWLFGFWKHGICPLCNYQTILGNSTSPSFHYEHHRLTD